MYRLCHTVLKPLTFVILKVETFPIDIVCMTKEACFWCIIKRGIWVKTQNCYRNRHGVITHFTGNDKDNPNVYYLFKI